MGERGVLYHHWCHISVTTTATLDLAGGSRLLLPIVQQPAPDLANGMLLNSITTNTRVITYAYDGLLRLTSAGETPGNVYAYSYDLAGNRLTSRLNGALTQNASYNVAN